MDIDQIIITVLIMNINKLLLRACSSSQVFIANILR